MENWIATRLLTGTLYGVFVVTLVWLACRWFPRIPAPVQAALWWLASLKLLAVFLPLPAVPLPLLPASDPPAIASLVLADLPLPSVHETPLWLTVLVAGWAIGLLAHVIALGLAFRRVRGLVRRAGPAPASAGADAPAVARAVGLRWCPEVRVSGEIIGPLVSGIRRPVVLLPATLPHADWRVAIAHEFVHVRRHDLVLGWVPALAERLFFFHPLARLAAREYVTAREAACDASVLRTLDVPPGDYARLLVDLGVARTAPLPAAGGAPASKSSLRRRLDMLQHPSVHGRTRHTWLLAAAFVMAVVPFELSARQAPAPVARPVAPAAAPDAPARAPASAAAVSARRPVARAAGPQTVAPVAPTPERATLDAIEETARIRQQRDARTAAEQRGAVERLAAQTERVAREQERAVRQQERAVQEQEAAVRRRNLEATDVAIRAQLADLAAQQAEWARDIRETEESLRILVEEQKQLAEALKQLTRETERIGNAVSPRK